MHFALVNDDRIHLITPYFPFPWSKHWVRYKPWENIQ